MKEYRRHSRKVTKDRRWPALRQAVLRRDDYQCRSCGSQRFLEVDHIKSVRDRPDLSFEISNLQALCKSCHARKTLAEVGRAPVNPKRKQWLNLLKQPIEEKTHAR